MLSLIFSLFKMVERYSSELSAINLEIEAFQLTGEPIKQYVTTGLELLANLDTLFMESDYEGKRILAGSLFTQKLIFGNEGCRTTQINEVVEVLTRNSKGFGGSKKGKAAISDSFFAIVPYGLKLSNIVDDFQSLRNLMNSRNWKSIF